MNIEVHDKIVIITTFISENEETEVLTNIEIIQKEKRKRFQIV